jgi:hypothetical protein
MLNLVVLKEIVRLYKVNGTIIVAWVTASERIKKGTWARVLS